MADFRNRAHQNLRQNHAETWRVLCIAQDKTDELIPGVRHAARHTLTSAMAYLSAAFSREIKELETQRTFWGDLA